MNTRIRRFWQLIAGRSEPEPEAPSAREAPEAAVAKTVTVELAEHDPLVPYFLSTQGVVEVDKLNLESPTLNALKESGVKLTIPLISQGELIGLLNLGPRLSEQEYSADDRRLLGNLATQAAPAVRVAQLVRQQQAEARRRERIEQELRVARIIQQTLLPKQLPELAGWEVSAYYQPARDVGGDFYDFISFADGKLGIVIGDVTDKGIPAALVMATTRSLLRGAAERLFSPAAVLERANELLCTDIPANMFVTCLYAILEPATGRLCYANAGHNLPYRRTTEGIDELWATGMPLGLMPGMSYEEKVTMLKPGETLLLSSDGLVEAHNPVGDMFSFPRIKSIMAQHPGGSDLLNVLLEELTTFTGPDYDQEDDISLVTVQWLGEANPGTQEAAVPGAEPASWRPITEFQIESRTGNERIAVSRLAEALSDLPIPEAILERLKTAVAEATMNAMEHGNRYQADKPVHIEIRAAEGSIGVRITDQGGGQSIPEPQTPDLEAKLRGEQTPRGWGLFLIKNMVDEMNVTSDANHHMVELIVHFEGGRDES